MNGYSNNSAGVNYGGYFEDWSTSGCGVYGVAKATGGTTHGVFGASNSSVGYGVYGQSVNSVGVYGDAFGSTGINYGVEGFSASTSGRGVYGVATAASGTTYAVRGYNPNAAGYAIYAAGDLGCSGTKSFVIDHPFDPENKYLKHYCAEGPEPRNVYQGSVLTDRRGYAWVELPSYFSEINKDPLYQLTVIDDSDDFVMAKVTKRIEGNRFQIRTSKPHVEVCWRVDAVRNDAWVRKHGAPVEVEKDELERGKYQHPDLYDQPAHRSIDYRSNRPVRTGGGM